MDISAQILEFSILRSTPELIAWGIGIVLAVLMVRRGGGRAEKLLLAGCSLMFVARVAGPLLSELVQSLPRNGMSYTEIAMRMSLLVSLPTGILRLAGFVCLVWAFWVKFWTRRREPA